MGRTYEIKDEDEFGHYKDEVPAHPVDVSTFRMGATLVTVGMWREYVRDNKHLSMPKAPDWDWIDDHPMVNVSWNDIVGLDGKGGYCAWASRVSSVQLSLPSEAQFEYAAKCGSRNLKFPWGKTFEPTKVWCASNIGSTGRTAPVGRNNGIHFNQFGIADLSGNVKQWCFDAYMPYGAQKRNRLGYPLVAANPVVLGSGILAIRLRVIRGCYFNTLDPANMRCAVRGFGSPDFTFSSIGFRLIGRSK